METMAYRTHLDSSIEDIGRCLFGPQGPSILKAKTPSQHALVDDWGCLKAMVIDSFSLSYCVTARMVQFNNVGYK